MNNNVVVRVQDLYKAFQTGKDPDGFVAVDHISFTINQGEIVGLLGPNGAGKTTTIQMLLSTLRPTSGSINYFGKDFFTHRSSCLEHIGFASTYVNFSGVMSVRDNLRVYGMLYGLSGKDLEHQITTFLEMFGIAHMRDVKVSTLSAGQKTRVMLCKAFLSRPKIVLLDEPTASLDPDIAHLVREFVKEQSYSQGTSVLFTSHNMDEVAYVCQRVLVMASGKIIANNTPEHLAASVTTTYVQFAFGDDQQKALAYFAQRGMQVVVDEQYLNVSVDEHAIAALLIDLAKASLQYAHIAIKKPSLEDYFISISQQQNLKQKITLPKRAS